MPLAEEAEAPPGAAADRFGVPELARLDDKLAEAAAAAAAAACFSALLAACLPTIASSLIASSTDSQNQARECTPPCLSRTNLSSWSNAMRWAASTCTMALVSGCSGDHALTTWGPQRAASSCHSTSLASCAACSITRAGGSTVKRAPASCSGKRKLASEASRARCERP